MNCYEVIQILWLHVLPHAPLRIITSDHRVAYVRAKKLLRADIKADIDKPDSLLTFPFYEYNCKKWAFFLR